MALLPMTVGGEMLRDKCRTCGSTDIYHGRLAAQGGVAIASTVRLFRLTNAARGAVCLTCGGIEPYLDNAGIDKVRGWKAAESGQVLPGASGQGSGVDVRTVMIFLAIVGALAAFFVRMWDVAQKLK